MIRSTISSAADELLAGPVAAALRLNLVLEVHAGGAGTGELAGRAGDHVRRTEAGVGVDEERKVGHRGDPAGILGDVGEGRQPEVGDAEGGVGDAGSGEVERPEAGAFGEKGAVGVDRPRHLERSFGGEGGAQAFARSCRVGHDVSFLRANV